MHGNGLEGLYDVFGHLEENTDESESRSVMSDSVTPWTMQSMEFSRPEYWSG